MKKQRTVNRYVSVGVSDIRDRLIEDIKLYYFRLGYHPIQCIVSALCYAAFAPQLEELLQREKIRLTVNEDMTESYYSLR